MTGRRGASLQAGASSFWDKLKGFFGGKEPEPPADEPAPEAAEEEEEEEESLPRKKQRSALRTTRSEDRRIEEAARACFAADAPAKGIELLVAQSIFVRSSMPASVSA